MPGKEEKHLHAGRVQRVRRGVYRLVHFPPGDHEDLAAVWLWSDRAGVFSHETALFLHGLSDALPSRVHITLPESWRPRRLRVPRGVLLHHAEVTKDERAWVGPVPVTTPRRTLADCIAASVAPDLVEQAIEQACGPRRRPARCSGRPQARRRSEDDVKRRTYDTPAAFKRALEDRLKAASTSGVDFARRRQLIVFDRFLARMVVAFGEAVMLKGGLVLELRLERARTTKDVDLRLAGSGDDILERLQAAGALDLGDFMRFDVAPDPDTPEIVGDGVQYDGYRFRAECRLAGKVYGARFGVDVALGGVLSGDVEEISADDLLAFAGIAPPKLRVVPVETHLAEKLHAYTMPRDRPNTRVKDLPDLALLGTIRPLEAARVR